MEFDNRYEHYKYDPNVDNKTLANFLLYTVCSALLYMKLKLNKCPKLGKQMFNYMCKQIMQNEIHLSQIDIQKMHISTNKSKFLETVDETDEETLMEGSITSKSLAADGEDKKKSDIEKEDDEDEDNMFSLDELDIDKSDITIDDDCERLGHCDRGIPGQFAGLVQNR